MAKGNSPYGRRIRGTFLFRKNDAFSVADGLKLGQPKIFLYLSKAHQILAARAHRQAERDWHLGVVSVEEPLLERGAKRMGPGDNTARHFYMSHLWP